MVNNLWYKETTFTSITCRITSTIMVGAVPTDPSRPYSHGTNYNR